MKGIFVNDDGSVKYATEIVNARKPVETRTKNMLAALVGERAAIVKTGRGCKPTVIGFTDVVSATLRSGEWLDQNRDLTLIPKGSKYDADGRAKWCYLLENAVACDPYPLPGSTVRHGRSWCEF